MELPKRGEASSSGDRPVAKPEVELFFGDVPPFVTNLLRFYYHDGRYRRATEIGLMPKPRKIVWGMLELMRGIEDVQMIDMLLKNIVEQETELVGDGQLAAGHHGVEQISNQIVKGDFGSEEEDSDDNKTAQRFALGVIQSNSEHDYLKTRVGQSESGVYVVSTEKPCTPLLVALQIVKGHKRKDDFLDPFCPDFNPSLISRIYAVSKMIASDLVVQLLYQNEHDLPIDDRALLARVLRAQLDRNLMFFPLLPKDFFSESNHLEYSGALFYTSLTAGHSEPECGRYAFSVNATQVRQRTVLKKFHANAGYLPVDSKIEQRFLQEYSFITNYIVNSKL